MIQLKSALVPFLFVFYCTAQAVISNETFTTVPAKIVNIPTEIRGYHFHTYFFQANTDNTAEALQFRKSIQDNIDNGFLSFCRLNKVNMEPRGPHPIGSFETCCNKSSISAALTWFMENHGNLSILLHPLTRFEVLDHSDRAMFLGPSLPLDLSVLSDDLEDRVDKCLPIANTENQASNSSSNNNAVIFPDGPIKNLSLRLRAAYRSFRKVSGIGSVDLINNQDEELQDINNATTQMSR